MVSALLVLVLNTGFAKNQKEHIMNTELSYSDTTLVIEFYHDVLCAWCYALSPRIRKLSDEYPEIEVYHRSFALSPNKERISDVFGSKEEGKRQIIEHWRAANKNDDKHRINANKMEQKDFDYPHSMPALLACKAAELQGGQTAHWNYFDAVQKVHLTDCLNIYDSNVLIKVAESIGLDMEKFIRDFESQEVKEAAELDLRHAHNTGINSVPSVNINGKYKISGAVSYAHLKEAIDKIKREEQ